MQAKTITESQLIEGWIRTLSAAGYSYKEMGSVFKRATEKQAQLQKEKELLNKRLDYNTSI